jgi:hypothetical protein
MLKLTSAQVDALSEERLVRTICGIVEKTLPHRLPPGRSSREVVPPLVQLGKTYGVTGERGLARFVCLALIVGERSMRQPEVAAQFRSRQPLPDVLVNNMLRKLAKRRA